MPDARRKSHRCRGIAAGGAVMSRNTSSSRPRSTEKPPIRQSRSSANSARSAAIDMVARRHDQERRPSLMRFRSRRFRQRAKVGADPRLVRRGDLQPHRIVVARARRQLGGRAVGKDAAVGDDDRPAAHRLDLLQEMRRDDDRLLRLPSRRGCRASRISGWGRARRSARRGSAPAGRGSAPAPPRHGGESPSTASRSLLIDLTQMHQLDDVVDARRASLAAKAADMRDEAQEVGGIHIRIGRRPFGQIADSCAWRRADRVDDVVAADTAVPRSARESRWPFSSSSTCRRRWGRESPAPPLGNRERDVVDRHQRAEISCRDCGFRAFPPQRGFRSRFRSIVAAMIASVCPIRYRRSEPRGPWR